MRAPTVNFPNRKSASKQSFITAVSPITTNTDVNANVKEIRNQPGNVTPSNENDAFIKPCVYCKRELSMEKCKTMSKLPHKEKVGFLKKKDFVLPV